MGYIFNDNRYLSPEFLYIASFIPQAVLSFWYIEKWDINLSGQTMAVLLLSVSSFLIVSIATKAFWATNHCVSGGKVSWGLLWTRRRIDTWKLDLFIVFQGITLLLIVFFLIRSFGTSLQKAMYYFRAQYYSGYEESGIEANMPTFLKLLKRISYGSGFFWGYLLAREIVIKKKEHIIRIGFNLLLSGAVGYISSGGRKEVFTLAVAFVVCYICLKEVIYQRKKRRSVKSFIRILLLVVLGVFAFFLFADIGGRTIRTSLLDYIARYIVAPIKNLDLYLLSNEEPTYKVSQSVVMSNVIGILTRFGLATPVKLNYTYNIVNGMDIGNAFTTFRAYYHDFGYVGVVLFNGIKAFICQVLFLRIKGIKNVNKVSISLIVFSYLLFTLVFSFFSNFFYLALINTTMIWYLVIWVLICWFMKTRFRIGRIYLT